LRLRALPAAASVFEFIEKHQRVYLIEQNRDGQMRQALALENPEAAARLISILSYDGLPVEAHSIAHEILRREKLA
jgi:2-oxoglutarate ferredoxin oxidoreductase subunit alpha